MQTFTTDSSFSLGQRLGAQVLAAFMTVMPMLEAVAAQTSLANAPIRATTAVPANVMLDLSVEWPTGNVQAYNDENTGGCPGRDGNGDSVCYFANKTYLGYFDPFKCYNYAAAGYFEPVGYTSGASAAAPTSGDHTCSGQWSGNYLNWATMQTTDTFRWAMTGGDRIIDTAALTVLEKARHDGQGGFGQFPIKRLGGPAVGSVTPVAPNTVTPFNTEFLFSRVQGLNSVMWVSQNRSLIRNNNHPGGGNNPANDLLVPPPTTATYTEFGLCATYTGPGVCTQTVTADPDGERQVTIQTTAVETGQCPSGTVGVVACANTTAPVTATRRVRTLENGVCPVAGSFSCVNVLPPSRQVRYSELGTCPAPAIAGTSVIACQNNNPSAGRRRVERRYDNGGACPHTYPGTQTPQPGGSYPSPNACQNVATPSATRRVERDQTGACPPSPLPTGYEACTVLTAASPGTRTVTLQSTANETGQCPSATPNVTACTNTVAPSVINIREISGAPTSVTPYYVRVRSCNPAFPESQTTCTPYGTVPSVSFKPTGLIQENYRSMRFGAFGYLLDNNQLRDGGVLRARMKDVGPERTVPGASPVANTRTEWDATTGVYNLNSEATDATATGLGATRSGVVPYLNKFGRAGGYKSFDPVSELFAESIKYFKNSAASPITATASYTSGLNATQVDGFPVISNWAGDYPIQFSCQKNFIIGIADANTHKDKNLSGGISNAENEPAAAAGVDTAYNVATLTNTVGNLERTTSGSQPSLGGNAFGNILADLRNCCNGSAYLAGLAYYANTTDLRPDLDNLNGIQNIKTYYVDVRESGSWGTSGDPRNQLWLAAKYGGFKDENNNGAFDAADTWIDTSVGLVQGFPKPKNYFAANQPERLVAGLRTAFRDINSIIGSGAGVGLAATNVSTQEFENGVYQVLFNTGDWSGSVNGLAITGLDRDTGAIITQTRWNGRDLLNVQGSGTGWNTNRMIVTAVPGSVPIGQPFRIANLNSSQLAALGATTAEQTNVLEYLRGRRTQESVNGGPYRSRNHLLGDIVDSEAVFVTKPNHEYLDALNPGYSTFKTTYANRLPMVYVGANDGMLHGFDARVDGSAGSGSEKFAFVPSFVYNGPTSPAVDGLKSLTNVSFDHHYMVNATPAVRDVDFARTGGDPTAVAVGTTDWRTLLVGGLGKGGRGFFALDVTNPADFTSETAVAGKVLWEFSDEDMGFSFGRPWIVKTRKWGWVVLVTSGYNNTLGTVAANRGKGFLYVLNAKTGALLQKIGTGYGSETNPSGFAQIGPYSPSFADFTTDEVYGGDLEGNVWRFDFRSPTADVPAPVNFAVLTDGSGNRQPITTVPVPEINPRDLNRYVFVGTGRSLDISDTNNPNQQAFYAIRDGTRNKRFGPTANANEIAFPTTSGVTAFPIVRSNLAANTDLIAGLSDAQIVAKPMGWYYELTGVVPASGTVVARERINLDMDASAGTVLFIGNLPQADTCNPNGVSRQYVLSYSRGKSLIGTSFIETSAAVKAQLVVVPPPPPPVGPLDLAGTPPAPIVNQLRSLVTDQGGVPRLVGGSLSQNAPARLINWREVLE